MLNWTKQFNIFCLLDNQGYTLPFQQYEYLLAAGDDGHTISADLNELDAFIQKGSWYFGHLSYQLTSQLYPSAAADKADKVGFPDLFFFKPKFLLSIQDGELSITATEPDAIFHEINDQSDIVDDEKASTVTMNTLQNREAYIDTVRQLQRHIRRGDCYEINYCIEFADSNAGVDPFGLFKKLVEISPNPYSVLYRLNDRYLLCSSPERFLKKSGNELISQPMKGTAQRIVSNADEDSVVIQHLLQSEKERSENVMVVDLVRNDLSQVCEPASVHVKELFGVHSFPQVHQLVSTVAGKLQHDVSFSEIVKATFPMGSMTGAPKKRVVELINQYEKSARGIFSGAVGYIDPQGDFDFNVVIRSMMYNSSRHYLSYQVGSGITFYCSPEKEWEECMLKVAAIKKVLA